MKKASSVMRQRGYWKDMQSDGHLRFAAPLSNSAAEYFEPPMSPLGLLE
jgi:hypothetical protein